MQKQVKYWLYSHIFDPGFAEGVGGGGGGLLYRYFSGGKLYHEKIIVILPG